MTYEKNIELEAACSLKEQEAREILSREKSWFDKFHKNKQDIVFSFNQDD